MEEMQVFTNPEFGEIRTISINNEPWFVGRDVAERLGHSNPQRAIRDHVDAEDKGVTEIVTPGGKQKIPIINESGLYSLILSSKLPTAKDFKHWVTSDVLPAIRRHGMYATDELLNNPDLAISVFTQLKKEREMRKMLEEKTAVQKKKIAELEPKATYCDLVLQGKNTIAITQIAKDYGMSAVSFNSLLHKFGIQYKTHDNMWVLYQKYAGNCYTKTVTHRVGFDKMAIQTYWTQKGRLFLYEFLKEKGILPEVERERVG